MDTPTAVRDDGYIRCCEGGWVLDTSAVVREDGYTQCWEERRMASDGYTVLKTPGRRSQKPVSAQLLVITDGHSDTLQCLAVAARRLATHVGM